MVRSSHELYLNQNIRLVLTSRKMKYSLQVPKHSLGANMAGNEKIHAWAGLSEPKYELSSLVRRISQPSTLQFELRYFSNRGIEGFVVLETF